MRWLPNKIPALPIFGDYPWLPEGLRAARRGNGGGSPSETDGPVRTNDIAHRDSVNNR